MSKKLTYKDAGVDIDAADSFVKEIKSLMERTYTPRVMGKYGGFGGLFSLDYDTRLFKKNYKNPVLVACTDGVGTKLEIAERLGKHDTVGIDLVAMCVNDLVTQGAEPLFFLDYIATGKVKKSDLVEVIKGISRGCRSAGCVLLGGETAEMPGFYKEGRYELAGFAVGVVEKKKIVDGSNIEAGDVVIGLGSNGLHSNGFSLVRKVFFGVAKMKLTDFVSELECSLAEELIKPTKVYAREILSVIATYRVKKIVRGIAHITGGGLVENIPRILPKNKSCKIRKGTWPVPPIFTLIQKLGSIDESEMFRVFNMGIGMVLICPPFNAYAIIKKLKRLDIKVYQIGRIEKGKKEVVIV